MELVTDEGDQLSLKSKLTPYLAMAKVFTQEMRYRMDFVASEKEDMEVVGVYYDAVGTEKGAGWGSPGIHPFVRGRGRGLRLRFPRRGV